MLKSAQSASTTEGSPAALATQTAREVLLGILGDDTPITVVERVHTALVELADLEREVVLLRRQNAVLQADQLGGSRADMSLEDRGNEC